MNKKFTVIFIDAGNCDIFSTQVEALGYRSAITAATRNYRSAGHKTDDIKEVRILAE